MEPLLTVTNRQIRVLKYMCVVSEQQQLSNMAKVPCCCWLQLLGLDLNWHIFKFDQTVTRGVCVFSDCVLWTLGKTLLPVPVTIPGSRPGPSTTVTHR